MKKLIFPLVLLYMLNCNISTVYANFNKSDVKSTSYCMVDPKSGIVVSEKNSNEKLAPASVTKVMTALLVLEKSEENLDNLVTFSHKAVFSTPRDSSNIAINEGEQMSVKNALYGLMLPSANDVANGLAEYTTGSIPSFATLMNNKAKALGATNTNFVNPNGLDNSKHYTTAKDMSLIMSEAITHPFFLTLIGTINYTIPPTNKQPLQRDIVNSNKMIMPNSKYYCSEVLGSKTGYTISSRHSIASVAKKDGNELVVVTLKGEKDEPYTDTKALLKYGFATFKNVELVKAGDFLDTVNVVGKIGHPETHIGKVTVSAEEASMSLPVVTDEASLKKDITFKVNVSDEVIDTVKKGDTVGSVSVYYKNKLIDNVNIVVTSDTYTSTFSNNTVKNNENDIRLSNTDYNKYGDYFKIVTLFKLLINIF